MLFLLRLLQCIDNGSTHSFSAQMLAEDTPLLVDGYDERNTTELIFVHRFPSRIGSQQLYPLHLLFSHRLAPVIFLGINGNTEESNIWIVLKLFIILLQIGNLLTTGTTPTGPKVDDHDLPFEGIQTYRLAFVIVESKGGCRLT